MIFKNKYDLPESWCTAVMKSYSQEPYSLDLISATALDMPPRVRILQARHWDEIEVEVSEECHKLWGTLLHKKITEMQDSEIYMIEQRISLPFQILNIKKTLVGRPDLYHKKLGIIEDYKTTSVWSYIFNKEEWDKQLNVYAYLINEALGLPVNDLMIVIFFKDWYQTESQKYKDYPKTNPCIYKPRLWTKKEQYDYIANRIVMHGEAESLPDDQLPICTPEERYHQPDIYAIYKIVNGKESSKAIDAQCKTEKEALDRIKELKEKSSGEYIIKLRRGYDKRCYEYCNVNKFCNFYKELINGKQDSDNTEEMQ